MMLMFELDSCLSIEFLYFVGTLLFSLALYELASLIYGYHLSVMISDQQLNAIFPQSSLENKVLFLQDIIIFNQFFLYTNDFTSFFNIESATCALSPPNLSKDDDV